MLLNALGEGSIFGYQTTITLLSLKDITYGVEYRTNATHQYRDGNRAAKRQGRKIRRVCRSDSEIRTLQFEYTGYA
jgi:hypothetical protein